MNSQPIAVVEFNGIATRLVYEVAHGQCVLEDEGAEWYGVWYVPSEELKAMIGKQPINMGGKDRAPRNA